MAFIGDDGKISVLSQKHKQLLFDLKMNGSCESVSFSTNNKYLFSVGNQAEIYQWDLSTRRCLAKVKDEGNFHTTKIVTSPDNSLLATSSKMGVVNLYSLGS
mmetsp:Transcript_38354/g.36716  ORF Transcript_38354/g.36716 Transcript_38354/m.36716 type:complete len:102 (-) Transcript_38354:272-577(-)|eukprot:CAMPEP_0170561582 /NCGR_PEP_ID=MMETSP0211-20121228/55616_1 /TAXON_ID=311385 /ORGANISM="Pseudokeronopsis sp., Strain OXSARD2" /LENGTH=101 /DNA_ID=CAMNT_0010877313 /DNA_START=62 /DNA_END=367 /DNA_ORIENTATION=+